MRSEAGMEKFGVSMDEALKTRLHWIENTQEELADAILYLEKLKDSL